MSEWGTATQLCSQCAYRPRDNECGRREHSRVCNWFTPVVTHKPNLVRTCVYRSVKLNPQKILGFLFFILIPIKCLLFGKLFGVLLFFHWRVNKPTVDSGMPSVVVCIPVKCILKIYISVQCRDGKGVWLSVCGTRRIVCLYWLQIESRKRPLPRASVCFPTYPTH